MAKVPGMTKQSLAECFILIGLIGFGVGAYWHVSLGFAMMCVGGIITALGLVGFFYNLSEKDTDADGS